MDVSGRYDVVLLGAGMAGLTLSRQLELQGKGSKRILILDNRAELPGQKQKVGESLVQVAGYYLTRILVLEEHLLREQLPKYNLRFHWKTTGTDNTDLSDYARSFIGKSSNVATYQVNRNTLEVHLLDLARQSPNVELIAPILGLNVDLSETGPHRVKFQHDGKSYDIEAEWVVDTSGRFQLLKKRRKLQAEAPLDHGSSWCWVEGLVDIEKLTDLSPAELRHRRDMKRQGLFPMWLATNHFCGEGFWLWVIPLKGLTSLGVVFDKAVFPAERVSTAEKLVQWICEEFPLFARDLPKRKIVDSAWLARYSYDCVRTISDQRWAISGMSGRFSDPLYSPGSDLIAFHNTVIADAIFESDPSALKTKVELYEALAKVVYDAYIPSYSLSYDALGDQETFTIKYAWELAVYFVFYAFPFINDLFTDARFLKFYFRKFGLLGPINRNLQKCLSDYYQWKKKQMWPVPALDKDFLDLTPLKKAEMSYYQVVSDEEAAEAAIDGHMQSFREFARYIFAHVTSQVLGDPRVVLNRSWVSSIKLHSWKLDPDELRESYAAHAGCGETYEWSLDASALEVFRPATVMPRAEPMHVSSLG